MSYDDMVNSTIRRLKGGLIVSCQAAANEPLHGAEFMARMALAAQEGGAAGIRANGAQDIREIKRTVSIPVIGINKIWIPGCDAYITPTTEAAEEIIHAGADIVAIDCIDTPRPNGLTCAELIHYLKSNYNIPIMADVASMAEGVAAVQWGADMVATTLAGYRNGQRQPDIYGKPDFDLIASLVATLSTPIVAEGRFWEPNDVTKAIKAGAYCVVVGSAITRPQYLTMRFVRALQRHDANM